MSNTITLNEINEAKRAYTEAQEAMNYADKDFVETAVYQYKMTESRLNALIKRAKNNAQDNVIQFPLQGQDEVALSSWPEEAMDNIGMFLVPLVMVLGVATLIAIMVRLCLGI
jgi:hypothetical protein